MVCVLSSFHGFCYRAYRALYILNWIYRFLVEENRRYHWIGKFWVFLHTDFILFPIFKFFILLETSLTHVMLLSKCQTQPGFQAWFRLLYMLIFSTTTSRGTFSKLYIIYYDYDFLKIRKSTVSLFRGRGSRSIVPGSFLGAIGSFKTIRKLAF